MLLFWHLTLEPVFCRAGDQEEELDAEWLSAVPAGSEQVGTSRCCECPEEK